MSSRNIGYLQGLVRELCALPRETGWLEFKVDNSNPAEIGEYISALANSAALEGKAFAYLLWGIKNDSHDLVGTNFNPHSVHKGNEELESWLLQLLEPKINFHFYTVEMDGVTVVLLEISRAARHPVRFSGIEYIRVGSSKKKLKDYPEKERSLWRIFDQTSFEDGVALEHTTSDEVLHLIDYPAFFDLLERPLPADHDGILEALSDDNLIRKNETGSWDIMNPAAILFAKRLNDFRTLKRKVVRVIQYRGNGRTEAFKEQLGSRGYAAGFEGLIEYINGVLPSNEVIGQALRKNVPMFPELAIRELVANALIHQDFNVHGAGPMVEIFDDRIEITNPGEPLVDTNRFVDTPPKSRNELIASLLRRMNICEERGSGIDKVVAQIELFQLPAPLFEVPPGFTRTVLFAHKPLSDMNKTDRIRACYLHACLCYVTRSRMTNSSIRKRFGIADKNSADASRLLKEAVEAGAIVIHDNSVGTKSRQYLPFWAGKSSSGKG